RDTTLEALGRLPAAFRKGGTVTAGPTTPSPASAPASGADAPSPAILAANCGDVDDGGPVAGPDCVTATIRCGETVVGHTRGGVSRFDSRFYEKTFCTPATTNHDSGDERVYLLELPAGDRTVDLWLDTPCADLDLAAIRVTDPSRCPTNDDPVPQCDMWPNDGTAREHVRITSQVATHWLVVVEGKGDAEGAFGLTVACADGR
ncbi:MAG: hypothetical protein ABMB14_21995, partial [Myxococcota bacterium]